jgi:uncharacterized protein YdaU (DUF1376 family)
MNKDPAFLFYTSDFMTGTALMTDSETGLYIKLLCIQHQHGGTIEPVAFEQRTKEYPAVAAKFVKSDDGYYNVRLLSEMAKRAKKSASLTANARKRWEVERQSKCNAIASGMHMPTEDEDENERVNDIVAVKGGYGGKRQKTSKKNTPLEEKDRAFISAKIEHATEEWKLAWEMWLQMRKEIKKPATIHAQVLTARELDGLTNNPAEQVKILEQSIKRSWAGVFPLSQQYGSGGGGGGGNQTGSDLPTPAYHRKFNYQQQEA